MFQFLSDSLVRRPHPNDRSTEYAKQQSGEEKEVQYKK